MTNAEAITQAIAERRTIRFTYSGKPRTADPHALYAHPSTSTILVDAYQRDGSSSGPLPAWRQFRLAKIEALEVTDAAFTPAVDYRADSDRYVNAVALATTEVR
jgi:predicted DNA-binding transcriptional regulator YafY